MSQKIALVIGNSNYDDPRITNLLKSESDADNLADVLKNPSICNFDSTIKLIDQNFEIIRKNIEELFYNRKKDDMVLLFYSGHGLMDQRGRLHLGAKNTDKDLLRGTAITSNFIRDVMDDSRSQRKILILDCCHSGAIGHIKGAKAITKEAFKGNGYGKVILTATDEIQYAWEDDENLANLVNSIFTHYLIHGLETGQADLNADGNISIDELYDYVHDSILRQGIKQTPQKWSFQTQGDIILAKNINVKLDNKKDTSKEEKTCVILDPHYKPLPGLLDRYDSIINDIIKSFVDQPLSDSNAIRQFFIDKIREICGAELVYYVKQDKNSASILCSSQSTFISNKISVDDFNRYLHNYFPKVFLVPYANYLKINSQQLGLKDDNCILIPIHRNAENSNVVIYGFSEKFSYLQDLISTLVYSLCKITNEFTQYVEEEKLTYSIYDEIRSEYHYVSNQMYEERFKYFCNLLQNITLYFEPIFRFDKHNFTISIIGWEALSRDKTTGKTPVELFKAAELWGVRFQTELDIYCLRTALNLYKKKLANFKDKENIKFLSVNVYPETILRTVYRKELEKLLQKERLIPGRKLILEISEKTLIPSSNISEKDYFQEFEAAMDNFRRKFRINFSIDDFGVGYSSISRLNRLLPSFVKVDREVLLFERGFGKEVIKYVTEVSYKVRGAGIKIVIEGLDEDSKISLSELINELEIEYIQGHCLGLPKPDIEFQLNEEKFREISEQLNWECYEYDD